MAPEPGSHTWLFFLALPVNLGVNWKKKKHNQKAWELHFIQQTYWRLKPKRQTLSSEKLQQRGSGERPVCMWSWQPSTRLSRGLLLVTRSKYHHEGFCCFSDMRRYKNWAHKISSWEYLTIWRPVQSVFLEHRVPHFCPPPWTPFGGGWRSAAAVARISSF